MEEKRVRLGADAPCRSERVGALPISRPGPPGELRNVIVTGWPKPVSGFGGAVPGQSKAATGCGGIEHAPTGMRSILRFCERCQPFLGRHLSPLEF